MAINRKNNRIATPASRSVGQPQDIKPVIIRTSKARIAYRKAGMTVDTRTTVTMTIPRDVLDATGIKLGDTLIVSGYADGSLKVERAGDLVSSDGEEML